MTYKFFTIMKIVHESSLYDQEGDYYIKIIKSFPDKESANQYMEIKGHPYSWGIYSQTISDKIIGLLCQEKRNREV